MKKYSPVYNQESIIYWPSFAGGIGMICLCGITVLIYVINAILFWVDGNVVSTTIGGYAVAMLLLLVWMVFLLRITVRSMFCRIEVTGEGFSIVNRFTENDVRITWLQVSKIEFHQENYRGRKQYRVYLKSDMERRYIAIPISMVDEEKLHSMIPSELLQTS